MLGAILPIQSLPCKRCVILHQSTEYALHIPTHPATRTKFSGISRVVVNFGIAVQKLAPH